MSKFVYSPAKCVPFRDVKVLEKVRKIKSKDMAKHWNPEFKIQIVKDHLVEFMWIADMFHRIKTARDEGRKIVIILPNPCPTYRQVAYLINKFQIDCKHVYGFAMDEYADENGNIAPETWPQGFTYAMKHNFLYSIDRHLRPPEKQIIGFTNKNIKDYGKMITDAGGADICYSGPGWTGHLAFIEPDAPEFAGSLSEWKKMGPRICTLSPFTLAQNSLHGSFGMSGDLAMVPPKAATIGPAQVIESKNRMDFHALLIHGTQTTWQRLISRLVLHGPVTPRVPESILQTLPTEVLVSESIARDIEPDWDKGY